MKFRLSILVFLAIATTGLVGALTTAAALSINLSQGFHGYLAARDEERLDTVIEQAVDDAAALGGIKAFDRGRFTVASLLRDAGLPMSSRRPPSLERAGDPGSRQRPPPEGLGGRIVLLDANGTVLHGPPLPRRQNSLPSMIRRPLTIEGRTIATILVLPRAPMPGGIDQRFLTRQYRLAGIIVLMLLLASLIPAWLIARRGAGFVRSVKQATGAIVDGGYAYRVPDSSVIELSAVTGDINAMADHLSRLEDARRRWLAEISHELRTPLTAMRGEIDAIADGIRPASAAAILSLREEVEMLGRLVDDLHFLAISDLSGPACRFDDFDALALCRKVIARFADRAEANGLALELTHHGHSTLPVRWDERRIEQVLSNVVTNSLRYTDAPGRVVLTVAESAEMVTLTLDDTAPGVSDAERARLFEPLYRTAATRERASAGCGLGLAVSASIVAAHAGTLTAAASMLGGLQIRITLPVDPARSS